MEALENTDEEAGTDASQGEVTRLQEALSTCQQQVVMTFSDLAWLRARVCFQLTWLLCTYKMQQVLIA